MDIRLEFDQINIYSKDIDKNETELETEIKNLLDSLERMRTCWQGEAFDHFYMKAYEYIERMAVLCDFMINSSEGIKKGTIQLQEQDETFSKDLQKEVEQDNEQNIY